MGLWSFFGRKPAAAVAPAESGDEVQKARVRARQRLIGAIVLVGIGIVAFPLLFETQPRPIPVDIPITIADKDKVPPLVMPPARQDRGSASGGEPTPDEAPSAAPAAPPASTPVPVRPSSAARPAAPEPVAAAKPAPAPAARPVPPTPPTDGARARALLEGKDTKPSTATPAAADSGRFVVQIGAYAGAASAREMRQKVEKLGQKTYTQEVKTASGPRIRVRVGPFGSRADAERAAEKLKAAGVPAAVMTL